MHHSLLLTFLRVHVSDFPLWYSTAGTVRGHSKLRTYLWTNNRHVSLLLFFLFSFFCHLFLHLLLLLFWLINLLVIFTYRYLSLRWFAVASGIFSTSTFNERTYTTKLFRLMLQYKHLPSSHWWKSLSHDNFYGIKNALYVKLKRLKHLNSKVSSVTSIFITEMQLVCED